MSFQSVCILALLALPSGPRIANDIQWSAEYDAALELAAASNKVVFVAVNMDGEQANDRLAEDVYHAKRIVELTTSTVNLVASNFEHSSRECSRFGSLTCLQHQKVDVAVRSKILKPDKAGFVIAPQHVFLSPSGEVLLSVPYEINEAELEWCLYTALRKLNPEFAWRLSSGGRAPRRLIWGDVYSPAGGVGADGRPLTRDEMLLLIKEVKRGLPWDQTIERLRQIVTSGEKEALEFIKTQLRSGGATGGGGGGGRRGGGGGAAARGGTDRRPQILRAIGAFGAPSYWEIVGEYADTSEDNIRVEAIVTLEQLAAADSLRLVQKLLKKEKSPELMKEWYRALGSVGTADEKVKKTLLKVAATEKDPVTRVNAVFALGYLVESPETTEYLFSLVDGEDLDLRAAAALALGMTRNPEHKERLEKRLEVLTPPEPTEPAEPGEVVIEPLDLLSLRKAIGVLDGGSLDDLRGPVRRVTQSSNPRPRIFGAFERDA